MLRYCFHCADGIHEHIFLYKPVGNAFIVSNLEEHDFTQPALIITGFSRSTYLDKKLDSGHCHENKKFIQFFKTVDITQAILAWFANHPQFTGDYKEHEIPYLDLDLMNLKKELATLKAHHQLQQHSIFSIYHIYASQIGYAIKKHYLDGKKA